MEPISVLVLGGTSGIGLAVNMYLRQMGLTVFAHGQETCDVLSRTELRDAVAEANPTHVVYSVGTNILDWTAEINRGDFRKLMDANVWGFVALMQELERHSGMERKPHSVVAVSSDAARRPMRTSLAYCASKAALDMAVRVASREFAADGWRINGVSPGKVAETPMTEYVDKRVMELRGWSTAQAEAAELGSSPIGRKLTPEEVAEVVCTVLMSSAAGWTGDIVTVNGGR